MKARHWLVQPDLRLTTHAVAGRYRLDDLLGRGGAADVYEGLDLRLRRRVAVKVFRPGGDSPAEGCGESEGRLLARMRHPGLVTVYDSGQEEGRPYLVMQLVKGTTLALRIAEAPLTPRETARTGAALASALSHVHATGVVHRDVKPSNILLDGTGTPHLTDFGISRPLDTAARAETGPLVGTAAYMAPEQVLGRGTGPAADVYSLGLVLLEALKGELEYAGPPLEAALARLHRPPVVPPGLPADLVGLLRAMTDPDAAGRPDADACFRALAAMPGGDGARPFHGTGAAGGGDPGVRDDTPWPKVPRARTGGTGPVRAAAAPGGRPPTSKSRPPVAASRPPAAASRPPVAAPRRSGRVLVTGAALAVLGAALTGSIGGQAVAGEDPASPAPHRATAESLPPGP